MLPSPLCADMLAAGMVCATRARSSLYGQEYISLLVYTITLYAYLNSLLHILIDSYTLVDSDQLNKQKETHHV